MINKVSTGRLYIEDKEVTLIEVTGRIEKIKIDIEQLSENAEISILTSMGERIVRYEGNADVILYPRNQNIASEIYSETENLNEISKSNLERWISNDYLKIVIDNKGETGEIDDIIIVYSGE